MVAVNSVFAFLFSSERKWTGLFLVSENFFAWLGFCGVGQDLQTRWDLHNRSDCRTFRNLQPPGSQNLYKNISKKREKRLHFSSTRLPNGEVGLLFAQIRKTFVNFGRSLHIFGCSCIIFFVFALDVHQRTKVGRPNSWLLGRKPKN